MGKDEKHKKYICWLCSVPGVGDRTIAKLKELCPDAEGIYRGGEALWKKVMNARQLEAIRMFVAKQDPDEVYGRLEQLGIGFVSLEEAESTRDIGEIGEDAPAYPERLRNIPDPPYGIFYRGKLPAEETLSVAVVGARECSAYGSYVAQGIGETLGECGVQVISGMARGIDGISQAAALDAGGSSYGVLGCGVDVCYPKSNRELYERLCEQGGILSAYPPGTEPRPQNFPPRNRIVSGLADVLIVVEARNKSGTLITVDMALEQGREVYAVPGRVTDRLSDGCNRLLKQGAGVFLSPEDFLREIGSERIPEKNRRTMAPKDKDAKIAESGKVKMLETPRKRVHLEPELQAVYQALTLEPQNVEEIGERVSGSFDRKDKMSQQKLMALLMQLCMENLAVQVTTGNFALLQFDPDQV